MNNYSELHLVEQPAIDLFQHLGWQTVNCFSEFERAGGSNLGRASKTEVILTARLRSALQRLNPSLPAHALTQAIDTLSLDRSTLSLVEANRAVYTLLKEGVKVQMPNSQGHAEVQTVQIIDWRTAANNDFLLASQFWINGPYHSRRPDLIGFVNGLPLLLVEVKAATVHVRHAYDDNLSDYKDTIPQLFWYNGFVLLSNGSQSKVGSLTAAWEHFADWKKINSEGEEGVVSLETVIRGACEKSRLLDILEHFLLYQEAKGGLQKVVGKYHQVLGVNRAIEAVRQSQTSAPAKPDQLAGRLGVFWHTQGSGKSISMIFFAQKILRTLPGDWTFVIITDRASLDSQIYKTFVRSGVVHQEKTQAESGAHLQQLLGENHRYVFTLIQKFATPAGDLYPVLSERANIIVIADEAHRTQYDTFARNMRRALPQASFIAFTGTPLIDGEEATKEVFGDYVSIYNFRQSIEDEATVRLYYENRVPQVQLTNDQLNQEIEQMLDNADADEEKVVALEKHFGKEYDIITRDSRLETIAQDIVAHFMGRGYRGKAMVIAIDKVTAVRMYDKVKQHWQAQIEELRRQMLMVPAFERHRISLDIGYMQETDMAVIVSAEQNEVQRMRRKGVTILPHRKRLNEEDLDEKFKDANDRLRIVFVCAMWMTGFDVPTCSTIYLDKPMRNHTLMQTIARANRVAEGKPSGQIVDYYGIFRNLEQALAIYGAPPVETPVETLQCNVSTPDTPVEGKASLLADLRLALAEATQFCHSQGVDLEQIRTTPAANFARVRSIDEAADRLLINDGVSQRFLTLTQQALKLYKAILPDPAGDELEPVVALLRALMQRILNASAPPDITKMADAVDRLLDASIVALGYVIPNRAPPNSQGAEPPVAERPLGYDISRIDFAALRQRFAQNLPHTAIVQLRSQIAQQLQHLLQRNRTRFNFQSRFQQLIAEYNAGSYNVEHFFTALLDFAHELDEEERRNLSEQLSEEDLAIFDLLTKPAPTLSEKERQQVKVAAQELLTTLKHEKLVLDWRNRQQARAAVRLCIEEVLDRLLPPPYDEALYAQKVDALFQHVSDSYFGGGKSIFQQAA